MAFGGRAGGRSQAQGTSPSKGTHPPPPSPPPPLHHSLSPPPIVL